MPPPRTIRDIPARPSPTDSLASEPWSAVPPAPAWMPPRGTVVTWDVVCVVWLVCGEVAPVPLDLWPALPGLGLGGGRGAGWGAGAGAGWGGGAGAGAGAAGGGAGSSLSPAT